MPPREYKVYTVHGYVHCFVHAGYDYHEAWHHAAYADGFVQSKPIGGEYGPGTYWKDLIG